MREITVVGSFNMDLVIYGAPLPKPGERGVFDGELRPAFRVEVVDSVGAGDTFVGAFVVALAEGHADPVRFAQAAAALQVQRRGALAVPTRAAVDQLLRTA